MNRRTHKTAKHAHARQRAHERFGISLTKDKINSIIRQIESGKAMFIEDEDVDDPNVLREIWKVSVGDIVMRVIYSPFSHTIITVMPWHDEREF